MTIMKMQPTHFNPACFHCQRPKLCALVSVTDTETKKDELLFHVRTIRPLTPQETQRDSVKKQCEIFEALIKKRWGDSIMPPTKGAHEDPTEEIEDPCPHRDKF